MCVLRVSFLVYFLFVVNLVVIASSINCLEIVIPETT